MYDYVELAGDKDYSKSLSIDEFNNLFSDNLTFEKHTNASFICTIENAKFLIQGIRCDHKGNYSFNSDDSFKHINLIEIQIPQGYESIYEDEIRSLITGIADKINWKINWRE